MTSNNKTTSNSSKKYLFFSVILILSYTILFLGFLAIFGLCLWGIEKCIEFIMNGHIAEGLLFFIILLLITILGVFPWLSEIAAPFLIKHEKDNTGLVEITESDAPELIKLLKQIASITHNDDIEHFYVSPSANHGVFVNSTFFNIFSPAKKNVEVGLSLLKWISTRELAAVITRDFALLSQEGKIYHLSIFASDLIETCDNWARAIDRMKKKPFDQSGGRIYNYYVLYTKMFGWIFYLLTIPFIKFLYFIKDKVEDSYIPFVRDINFQADKTACQVVGTNDMISYLYKTGEINNRVEAFKKILDICKDKNMAIPNYWDAFDMVNDYLSELTGKSLLHSTMLTQPLYPIFAHKVLVEHINFYHPDIRTRIEAIGKDNSTPQLENICSNEALIPPALTDTIGEDALNRQNNRLDYSYLITKIDNNQLKELIDDEFFWYLYKPFFEKEVIEFDYHNCEADKHAFMSNYQEDLYNILYFDIVKTDWINASAVANKSINSKSIFYNGQKYSQKNLPMDEIDNEYNQAFFKAANVYSSICKYALSKALNRDTIINAYENIFYAQKLLNDFSYNIEPVYNSCNEALDNASSDMREKDFEKMKDSLKDLRYMVKSFIDNNLNVDLFCDNASQEAIESLNDFNTYHSNMFVGNTIQANHFELLTTICNNLKIVHESILNDNKMIIINTCLGRD